MRLTATPSGEVAQTLPSAGSEWGLNREGRVALLRVRTRPEWHEDNLRELMWDNTPKCGLAREGKTRERERTFLQKAIRHNLARSQNKGLNEYQGRASWLQTGSSHHQRQKGRQVTARARRWGAILAPETASSTKLWAGSQLLIKSSWGPGQLTSARRVTGRDQLSRGDTQHTWDSTATVHLGNQGAGTGRGGKTHHPPGENVLAKHLVTWAAQTWEGHTIEVQPSLCHCGIPKNLNLRGLDLGSAHNPGPTLDSSPAEQPGAWAVQTGKAHTPWVGANPVWPRHCEHFPHTPVIFVCHVPPSLQHN